MKKQIVIIHGGHASNVQENFLDRLKSKEVSADSFKLWQDWKHNAERDLGAGFEVFNPRMPNGDWARYEEWKAWFERMFEFLEDGVVLVGHSLGGLFLAKYLSENIFPKKIFSLHLIAAPYEGKDGKHAQNANFYVTENLEKLSGQTENIYLYHSKDDDVVPFSDLDEYAKRLPSAHEMVFENKGHFNEPAFPELLKNIQEA